MSGCSFEHDVCDCHGNNSQDDDHPLGKFMREKAAGEHVISAPRDDLDPHLLRMEEAGSKLSRLFRVVGCAAEYVQIDSV